MTLWRTAKELAGLPDMPSTEFRARAKLLKLATPSRPRAGRGGGLEYDCSALPAATRQALLADKIAKATPTLPALTEAALPAQQTPPVPATVSDQTAIQRRPPSQADKACADARLVLVNTLLDLARTAGTTKASHMLALQLASGQCTEELQNTAKTANQRARKAAVSDRTLFRWLSVYQADGWWGLLPAASTGPVMEVDNDVAAVLGYYLSRDAQFRNLTDAAKHVNTQLGRDHDSWEQLYGRARRALPKVNNVDLIKARHSGAERAAKLPFKRRDTSVLKPLDTVLIDGHSFKAKVRHPAHGAPFAPEVTAVIDAATRKVIGWSVALSENVIAVGDALRHAVGNAGIPAIIYTDNGPGETGKQLDCPVAGIVARLGSDHRTGIPGHPQGHGLKERSWQTHMIKCAKQFGSYQGKDVDSNTFRKVAGELAKEQRAIVRAKNTGEVIKLSTKAPSWKQFFDAVDKSFNDYNSLHRHSKLPKHTTGPHAGKHMTPSEAWDAMLDTSQQHKLSELDLRMLFMPAMLRTAKRGEVTFLNQTYYNADLMAVDGQQVQVRYDIHDPKFVLIFTTEGEYVCEAKWKGNSMDYFPKPVVEMAREGRTRAAIKRLDSKIDLALRELQAVQQADGLALPMPSAPDILPPLMQTIQPVAVPTNQRPAVFDNASDRYEWLMGHRGDWDTTDADWARRYAASDDYAALADYFSSRGLEWNEGAQVKVAANTWAGA